MTAPDRDIEQDPRTEEVEGEHEGMPAEFIDTPANEPGDHTPPSPIGSEGQETDD